MAAGTQGWNVNSAKDRQDLRRGICKLHRWYVATPSDCPREGGRRKKEGKKERKKKRAFPEIGRQVETRAAGCPCGQRGFALTELKGARSGSFVPARE